MNAFHLIPAFVDRDSDVSQSLEWPDRFDNTMSEQEGLQRQDLINGLYADLRNHPGLFERRMYIGSSKPQLPDQMVIQLNLS